MVRVDCRNETAFLDVATGIKLDKISYAKDQLTDQGIPEIFIAGATCIVPEKDYFVCARFDSTRLRILELKPPHRILKELGTERHAAFGGWGTQFVQCSSDGRFLMKTSYYDSRLFPARFETIIYHTTTWKIIWRSNQSQIVMSPDGQKLTFQKGNTLEIRNGPALMVLH